MQLINQTESFETQISVLRKRISTLEKEKFSLNKKITGSDLFFMVASPFIDECLLLD